MSVTFDPDFYKSVYPDLRFLNKFQLQEHYIKNHRKENRIGSEKQLNTFLQGLDYTFEIETYQSLHPDVPNDPLLAKIHFYMHGIHEDRPYNKIQLKNKQSNVLKLINDSTNRSTTQNNTPVPNQSVLFNIIIRTHNRELYFNKCMASILNQTYKNFRVIIAAQDPESSSYIFKFNDERLCIFKPQITNSDSHFYDDFCNQSLDMCNTGWIIYLDDDNVFVDNEVLHSLFKQIKINTNSNILVNGFARADKIIHPSACTNLNIGDIDTGNFCFAHTVKKQGIWPTQGEGDYWYFNKLLLNKKTVPYIGDIVAIKTQFTNKIANHGNKLL